MYTRFDIVWPDDETESNEPPSSVDALTYGLSTLSMSEDVVYSANSNEDHCSQCGQLVCQQSSTDFRPTIKPDPLRLVNNYAQYIRKFSVGNGPPQYIKEYTADKERGKMLNTLVARAVKNCRNMEIFVWDMPSGLAREVWIALASLKNRSDGQQCRLKRVWVRMHDPRLCVYEPWPRQIAPQSAPPPPGSAGPPGEANVQMTPAPYPPLSYAISLAEFQAPERPTNTRNVAYPNRTFSLLPPLHSLNVMEIDAPEFLYEMSNLINRSRHCLRELRVSFAAFIFNKAYDWTEVWEGEDAPDPYEAFQGSRIRSEKRAGGVLGTLFGRFFSVKEYERAVAFAEDQNTSSDPAPCDERLTELNGKLKSLSVEAHKNPNKYRHTPVKYEIHSNKLSLEKLELNFVKLSTSVLVGVVDWKKLTTLTLICCPLSDSLWLHLKRLFGPKPPADGSAARLEYPLALRSIRTDSVSTIFLKFLTDALSPNSLRSLHLRDRNPNWKQRLAKVTLKQIFKGPLRRHATSLEKLSIDSALRKSANGFIDSKKDTSAQYQQWMATKDVLSFITSGLMPRLCELCISIDYKDWHYFLRRLVNIPHLHVLYVPYLHRTRAMQNCQNYDPEDLAYQVADAITFRPEIGLSWFANHNQCYEIYETKGSEDHTNAEDGPPQTTNWTSGQAVENEEEEEDVDVDGADEEEMTNSEDDASSEDDLADSDDEPNFSGGNWRVDGETENDAICYTIRDTAFPDEKAEIFKFRRPEL